MDETEVIKEEQTESEQELDATPDTEETQVESDTDEDTAETKTEEPETEKSETGQSDDKSESATQTETVVTADFGKLEELVRETNALLAKTNELLESADLSLEELTQETCTISETQGGFHEGVNSGIIVAIVLLGACLGTKLVLCLRSWWL